jgi:hypothetical protein
MFYMGEEGMLQMKNLPTQHVGEGAAWWCLVLVPSVLCMSPLWVPHPWCIMVGASSLVWHSGHIGAVPVIPGPCPCSLSWSLPSMTSQSPLGSATLIFVVLSSPPPPVVVMVIPSLLIPYPHSGVAGPGSHRCHCCS